MNPDNPPDRYGSLQITLQWVVLLLLVAVYACIELRGFFPKGSDLREALKTWHFMLGLSVLILATVRVLVHLFGSVRASTLCRHTGRSLPASWCTSLFMYSWWSCPST